MEAGGEGVDDWYKELLRLNETPKHDLTRKALPSPRRLYSHLSSSDAKVSVCCPYANLTAAAFFIFSVDANTTVAPSDEPLSLLIDVREGAGCLVYLRRHQPGVPSVAQHEMWKLPPPSLGFICSF